MSSAKFNNKDWVELKDWVPTEDQQYFTYADGCVYAKFDKYNAFNPNFSTFYIKMLHFNVRMDDITNHMNYFLHFYDPDEEFFLGMMSVKFMIGERSDVMTGKELKSLIMARLVTKSIVKKIKEMATDLNLVDVDTDTDGKYKGIPKITKEDARLILAVSICIRLILPICIHFINVGTNYLLPKETRTNGYIRCFDKIFMDVITKFEKGERPIFALLCKFANHRADHSFKADQRTWDQKKQIHGDNFETYLEKLIHEVIIVKSLYKFTYNRSIVSFIDGVISKDYYHAINENYPSKPVPVENIEGSDEEPYLSHSESLEMSNYKLDESNVLIDEVNAANVMRQIRDKFRITITDEEYAFYQEHVTPNQLTMKLTHIFYSKYFKDTHAIQMLGVKEIVNLLVILKKYLSMKGMSILPQICTAKIEGKFKSNTIRNTKFVEKYSQTAIYQNVISEKYKYVRELNTKDDPVINLLSKIINSTYTLVDFDPLLNGIRISEVNMETIVDEYLLFLTII